MIYLKDSFIVSPFVFLFIHDRTLLQGLSAIAASFGDISVDILKSTVDIHLPFITNRINLSIEKNCLPEELKLNLKG